MGKILDGVVSIIFIFIVHKQITSDKHDSNEEIDDPWMIAVITFFISQLLIDKIYYPIFIAFITGGLMFFVKKAIKKVINKK